MKPQRITYSSGKPEPSDAFKGSTPRPSGRGVWEYVSASRLNAWLRCPLAFRLRYVDGILLPTTPSLLLGKAVHAGLEAHYGALQQGVAIDTNEAARRTARVWDRGSEEEGVAFKTTVEEARLKKQAVDLVQVYLAHVRHERVRPLGVEVAWEAPLIDPESGERFELPLVGILDLVLDGDDGPVIIDFKTAARGGDPLEILHEVQLGAYAILLRHVLGRQEAGLEIRRLIRTKTPKIEFYRFPPRGKSHLRRWFAAVRAYLADLDAERFIYRPSIGCSMCDYRAVHCQQWQGEATLFDLVDRGTDCW